MNSLLLKIDKISILSVEEVRDLSISCRLELLLIIIHLMSVVLRKSTVSVVVALLLPVVVHFVLDLDLAILFGRVHASTSITHFFELTFEFLIRK